MARLNSHFSSAISTSLACWACAIFSVPALSASAELKTGPSFSCAGQLTETELAICADPVLSAYDRAMAWAYARAWHSMAANHGGQSQWLVQRNACAGHKMCLVAAYHAWIGELDFDEAPAPNFMRTGLVDTGELFVQSIGGDWILFRVNANHIFHPHDGLGPNVSTGEVTGLVQLSKGAGVWNSDLNSPDSCAVQLSRLPKDRWRAIERGVCSGLGATLSGIYRRLKR